MAWIEKHGSTYLVRWHSGTKKPSMSFDSEEAAERYKKKIEYEASIGISIDPSNMTLEEYLEYWLPIHAEMRKKKLAPKTRASYESNIKCHIAPHLGKIKLIKLTPLHLQTFYAFLLKEGKLDLLKRQKDSGNPQEGKNAKTKIAKIEAGEMDPGESPRTVENIHVIIHAALKQAVKWQMVAVNVTDAVDSPEPEEADIQYLKRAQVNKFISLIKESPDYPIIDMAIMTGMRQGEILGLRWHNVDFETGIIRVREQLQYLPEDGFFFRPPKRNSKRDVPMQLPLQGILRAVKKEQDAIKVIYAEADKNNSPKESSYQDKGFEGLVFCRKNGRPIDGCGVTKRFQRLLTKNDFDKIRFHSLRHTFATMCRNAGVELGDVQDLLGHADISTTKKMYTHIEIEPLKKAIDKLGEYMNEEA